MVVELWTSLPSPRAWRVEKEGRGIPRTSLGLAGRLPKTRAKSVRVSVRVWPTSCDFGVRIEEQRLQNWGLGEPVFG